MKIWSCQRGMPECEDGLIVRRDRKNDVDMMSKLQPCLRAMISALGTFGDSMKPNFSATWLNNSDDGVIVTRSFSLTRGVSAVMMVRITLCWCSTLLCLRLCSSAVGANS